MPQGAASSGAGSRKRGIQGSPYSSLNIHTDFKKSSCHQPIITEGLVFSSSVRPARVNAQDCFERPVNPCGLHHKAFSYKEGSWWPVWKEFLQPGAQLCSESYEASEMPPTFAVRHPAFPLGFRRQRQKCWVKRWGGTARVTGLPAGGALEPPGPEAPPPPWLEKPGHISGVLTSVHQTYSAGWGRLHFQWVISCFLKMKWILRHMRINRKVWLSCFDAELKGGERNLEN